MNYQLIGSVCGWIASVFFITLLQKRNWNILNPIDPMDIFAGGTAMSGVLFLPQVILKELNVNQLNDIIFYSITLWFIAFLTAFSCADALWKKLGLSSSPTEVTEGGEE